MMEIKSVTKTTFYGANGKQYDTIDGAVKSMMVDRIATFLYENAGSYDPDYVAATEALADLLDVGMLERVYEAVKDD